MIRGKKVDTALADLEFSRKRIAKDVRKCVMSAVANAENNHGLDVNDLVVKEAYVGKNLVITRFHARGRGRMSPIEKPFAQLTVVVKAQEEEAAQPRRPNNGSQGQSDRASRRHQPHLGQPLVRQPRRVRPAAARGHAHPRSHPEAAAPGRHLQGRHRAPAQEMPRHRAHGAARRADRQEGRRHREAAGRARQAHAVGGASQHRRGQEARDRRHAGGGDHRPAARAPRRLPPRHEARRAVGDQAGCARHPHQLLPGGSAAPRSRASSGTARVACRCTRCVPTSISATASPRPPTA